MKMNLARLKSIEITLKAIADIEKAMSWYEDTSKPGPAYLEVKTPNKLDGVDMQLDREDFLLMMDARKRKLIAGLEERFNGFEYDPEADWAGDKEKEEND